MASAPALHRFLGLRAGEAATVWLFFWHNFLLGIGTILVYVSANVILLENHPETSLPIAYLVSAAAMMGISKVYTYFEHHLLLQRLAVRVLLSVIVLTFVMALLVFIGHSVVSAVAIMAGYRIIYLLTNLEFWGISAVVFDVRQGKRLFSVISAGDMPAKALGALLSIVVHYHNELYWLLLAAFGAYLGAMIVLQLTIRSHNINTIPAPVRLIRRAQPSFIRQLFGGSELVFTMCLSLMAIACVVTSVEYFFFVNVKHKFHAQADTMTAIGSVLAMTYLLAMLFKLMFSRQTFENIGIRRSLSLLPISGLVALVLFGGLHTVGVSETALLVYFCGLYLLLEVLRRAVFDPIFLVMFQPLSPPDRLRGHTLVKGFYEPLGMAMAGLLLLIFNHLPKAVAVPAIPFGWMAAFMGLALFYVRRSAQAYLVTLKDTLERRFSATTDLVLPTTAVPIVAETLGSHEPEDVLNAIDWLLVQHPDTLTEQAGTLLTHADSQVRYRVLNILKGDTPSIHLRALAETDPNVAVRERAAFWFARQANPDELATLLDRPDWALQAGLIDGWLAATPNNPPAHQRLRALAESDNPDYQIAALKISHHL
ncbi:MAG: Crp/Fnr family transcriptional regulator, partial [Bacteroidetes bacterium]|nr:Crp/Fnr family transcriptional regulator [Fibrella sp.]